jgi:hypothetical protein
VEGWTDAVVALPLADLGRGALEAAYTVLTGGKLTVTDQRFPGTLYTYQNIVENKDKVWGSKASQ